MLDTSLKEKFPFAYNYFSNLLEFTKAGKRKFPQAIIFEGADTKNQYLFALELARALNCQNNNEIDCNCLNCQWIKTHTHPNINIVSQIHFKPDGDETKTVISTKQAREIENSLMLSCDYHRVFIFFSSKEMENDEDDFELFKKLGYNTEFNFSIEPLNLQTFHPTTPNALLKSIEEPPEHTTFIFLTKSKEDILSTIVSRCLVFKLNGTREIKNDFGIDIFSKYHNLSIENAFDFSDEILNYAKDNYLSVVDLLNFFLIYLKDIIKTNSESNPLYIKTMKDIEFTKEAIDYLRANISDKIAIDTLILRIARGF